jgi:hypothetical protein
MYNVLEQKPSNFHLRPLTTSVLTKKTNQDLARRKFYHETISKLKSDWGQRALNAVASNGVDQASTSSTGFLKRRDPTGGFAYGMPRNDRQPACSSPVIGPFEVTAVTRTAGEDIICTLFFCAPTEREKSQYENTVYRLKSAAPS